ncbi:DUF2868 domain-containing protein [Piscinibacter defluvii]|uniref:DUF2868 domain-containing protein n=1 Tax=Piscinibacter defluvii TaxID=1796922 RepID=UPI000FDF0B1A|nr:DUF2868 domain-containing protein [Piscinibacter defluvii]
MKPGVALPRAAGPLLLVAAFAAGAALDALPGGQRINLFAPPLLAMLGWNLAVYALLLVAVARHRSLTTPQRRLAAWLHAAAALLACGAVLSMYARGSFLEFRAGWDSTFFDAPALHRFMQWLFGPAAALGGITLPTLDEFAALRFSAGGGGERAARWIHLYAITLAALVILPRTLLAFAAARASEAPAPSAGARPLQVLPYSYQGAEALRAGLRAALERHVGGPVELQLAPSLAQGEEAQAVAAEVLLLPLTATPEAETHGALLAALPAPPALVLLDESGFRRRFAGPDGARRLEERRALWRSWLVSRHLPALFVDLSVP